MEKTVRLLSNGNQIDFVVESNGLLCMYCGDDLFTADFDYKGVGVLIRTLEELRRDMGKKSEPAVSNGKEYERMRANLRRDPVKGYDTISAGLNEEIKRVYDEKAKKADEDFLTFEQKAKAWQELNKLKDEK